MFVQAASRTFLTIQYAVPFLGGKAGMGCENRRWTVGSDTLEVRRNLVPLPHNDRRPETVFTEEIGVRYWVVT